MDRDRERRGEENGVDFYGRGEGGWGGDVEGRRVMTRGRYLMTRLLIILSQNRETRE